jgi:superfamily II DNA or RNA helicase
VTDLQPTGEQQANLDAAVTGGSVSISAAAGSGKTSTLRMIAEARPKTQMLYLAFNKAIQVEADGSFPPNVTCNTAHALAYI